MFRSIFACLRVGESVCMTERTPSLSRGTRDKACVLVRRLEQSLPWELVSAHLLPFALFLSKARAVGSRKCMAFSH